MNFSFMKLFGSTLRGAFAVLDFLVFLYLLVLVLAFVIRLFKLEDRHDFVKYILAISDPPIEYTRQRFPYFKVYVEKYGDVDLTGIVLFFVLVCVRIFFNFLGQGLSNF